MTYTQFLDYALLAMLFCVVVTLLNFVLLFLIFKILLVMSEELNEVKQTLIDTQAVVTKVSKDVDNLHAKIEEITGEVPTAEEWAEVKNLASGLKSSLIAVDEKTEDAEEGPSA